MTEWATPRAAPRLRGRENTSLASRAFDRESPLRRLDWILMVSVLTLCVLGSLLVWSATRQREIGLHADPQAFLKKDLLNLTIGLGLGSCAALLDYRALRAYVPFIYGASILGLLVVLSPLGSTIKGAHSWIVLPAGFQVQPSEFAKVAMVVAMAMILGEKRDQDAGPGDRDVLLTLALGAVPIGLIMLQPDLGMVMVIVFMILGVLTASGAPKRWVIGLITLGVLFGAAILHFHLLKPYQEARLTEFAKQGQHLSAAGFNTNQSRIAIGSGGVFGAGLFHGTQTQGQFVPEQQTDFVFSAAGEELGFVGAGGILLLLGIVLWRALRIASRAGDAFGTLVASGVVAWFAFQAFINIGMTMGIMPVTGLPLPFVSYGGSAMFANMMAIGLLQNVYLRSRRDHA